MMNKLCKILMAAAAVAVLATPAMAADKLIVKNAAGTDDVFKVSDTGQLSLGSAAFTPDPAAKVHIKEARSGVLSLRVENPNIIGASDTLAQEQFVLGPVGAEHVIFQVLSDVQPSFPQAALMNAYTHDFFVRTNAQNVFKIFRVGAVADTLVMKNGNVGIGTATPTSKIQVVGLPTYASNAAAISGGLTVGAFYKTSTGAVMVVY